jgi:hypothetical protein
MIFLLVFRFSQTNAICGRGSGTVRYSSMMLHSVNTGESSIQCARLYLTLYNCIPLLSMSGMVRCSGIKLHSYELTAVSYRYRIPRWFEEP